MTARFTKSAEDDDTVFNYYQIGDKVRHHGGLNSIEKYDKSGDEIIFCNACTYLNDIKDGLMHKVQVSIAEIVKVALQSNVIIY